MVTSKDFADGRILCCVNGLVGSLTIANPVRKNALDDAMWRAIGPAIDWLAGEAGARVIMLAGGGGSDFSAGADISEFDRLRADPVSARIYEAGNSAAFRAIRQSSVPVIAVIRGICFGGGFGLAAAADLRICDQGARFAIPAARLGLAYPADAVSDIVRSLGPQRARFMLLGAVEMDADTALESGFVLERHDGGELERAATALAGRIASMAPLSVAASRKAISAVLSGDDEAMVEAVQLGERTFASADYAEGRAAFQEKRLPVFKGN